MKFSFWASRQSCPPPVTEVTTVDLRYNSTTCRSDGNVRFENLIPATQIFDKLGFVIMRGVLTKGKSFVFGQADSVRQEARGRFDGYWEKMRRVAADDSVLKFVGDIACSRMSTESNTIYDLTTVRSVGQVVMLTALCGPYEITVCNGQLEEGAILNIGDSLMWTTEQGKKPERISLQNGQYESNAFITKADIRLGASELIGE